MKYFTVNSDHPQPDILQTAVRFLTNSGVVAHATETVYGLAGVWDDREAIQKISAIKGRRLDKPYSIMVSSPSDIIDICGLDTPPLRRLLNAVFPGPITLVLKRERNLTPKYWNQFNDLGFRIPDHRLSRELIQLSQTPLITTSANRAAEPPPASAQDIPGEVAEAVDCLLDSGPCRHQQPSTVIKIELNPPDYTVLRPGAFPAEQFQQIFKTIW